MANRQQKRHPQKAIKYDPVNTDKLSMQAELKEKLSLNTLCMMEREITKMVENAACEAVAPAVERTHLMDWAVIFRVLVDQFGFGQKRLKKLFDLATSYLNDAEEGRLSLEDMLVTLHNDDGIDITWKVELEEKK